MSIRLPLGRALPAKVFSSFSEEGLAQLHMAGLSFLAPWQCLQAS